ncbi:hypothetical protein JMJ35_000853 [Cladonia borealis]|uniref:Uncharacterized protein n=1 Tax=Cladonia borealis TaxID=184061 RepID=A0AA39R7H3_9LECA|nr:hypothetical protein JMJ35_000853 [Cladonia borealis]
MTLVWRTRSGSLIQTEVGTIDVVNTFSAARSVYGWMGGTEGLRFLLDRIREETPFRGLVLMSRGPLLAHMDDARESFGGDTRTQVIGTTLCALAHEIDIVTPAKLFRHSLLPYLFGEGILLLDTLQSQLLEGSTLRRIINEGASRGLNDLFFDAATRLGFPVPGQGWRPKNPGQEQEDEFLGEVKMVAGFLKWHKVLDIGAGRFLRNGSFDGGGEDSQTPSQPPTLHYQHSTTGVLLLTALGDAPKISPEALQEDFEQVFDYVEKHLTID